MNVLVLGILRKQNQKPYEIENFERSLLLVCDIWDVLPILVCEHLYANVKNKIFKQINGYDQICKV